MSRKKMFENTRKNMRALLETKIMISIILLSTLAVGSLTYIPVQAPASTSPTYGTATVDGNSAEWDLTNDFFANMYEAGDITKDLLSKAYLRYDCDTDTLYVLVLAESGHTVQVSEQNAWVRVPCGDTRDPPVTFTAFEWIPPTATETADGWEASFSLSEGCHTINVHTNVDGGRTSEFSEGCAELFICCGATTTTVTSTETVTDTDCTTTVGTTTVTSTDTVTDTDCTTTVGTTTLTSTDTVTDTITDTITDTDCTTIVGTTTTTATTTVVSTTTATDCPDPFCDELGTTGLSLFGTIKCEGPSVIVGATSDPDLWRAAPAGTQFAMFIDSTAAALLWGICFDGFLYWDIDSSVVDQGTGETSGTGHEIMSGGPIVNAPVKWYEGQKLAPLYYKTVSGKANFFSTEGTPGTGDDVQLVDAQLAWSEVNERKDIFMIELFMKPGTEADPEYVVISYGYAGRGTLASSVYFKTVIDPNLSAYTEPYYIIQWDDTNANGHPDVPISAGGEDTYTQIYPAP